MSWPWTKRNLLVHVSVLIYDWHVPFPISTFRLQWLVWKWSLVTTSLTSFQHSSAIKCSKESRNSQVKLLFALLVGQNTDKKIRSAYLTLFSAQEKQCWLPSRLTHHVNTAEAHTASWSGRWPAWFLTLQPVFYENKRSGAFMCYLRRVRRPPVMEEERRTLSW